MSVMIRRGLVAAMAGVVLMSAAGTAWSLPQEAVKKAQPGLSKERTAPPKTKQAPKVAPDRSRIGTGPVRPATGKTSAASKRKPDYEPDPNAKYLCENTEVTLDPVWRKSGTLTWDFYIKSGGTAPLKIKARGG